MNVTHSPMSPTVWLDFCSLPSPVGIVVGRPIQNLNRRSRVARRLTAVISIPIASRSYDHPCDTDCTSHTKYPATGSTRPVLSPTRFRSSSSTSDANRDAAVYSLEEEMARRCPFRGTRSGDRRGRRSGRFSRGALLGGREGWALW